MSQTITLMQACPATLIPQGTPVELPSGATLTVTQALGNAVTLRSADGLFRVAAEHFPALGPDFVPPATETSVEGPFSEAQVWAALRQCFDPEIPVNIVDLGLIYDLAIQEVSAGVHTVEVKMTLTAPGCGMGPTIAADAKAKIESLPAVQAAQVDIVWDPQWTPHMISPEGRQVLGLD